MEMVGITHAHAFTMPLLALVLGVIFVNTNAREWLKRLVVVALFAGMVLELGLPWLARYGPAWTVHLFILSGVVLVGGLFTAVAVPLYEMWWLPETVETTARPKAFQPEKLPSPSERLRKAGGSNPR
jgi:hypothetical protein